MEEKEAETCGFNPFDLTKVWPHGQYPLIEVGEMEMNRNPRNYFHMVENAAFASSNAVPGISFSPDKMLQSRIFAYVDAHCYRRGTHYQMLPANHASAAKVEHYHKDGPMRFFTNDSGNPDAYYEPNQYGDRWQMPAHGSRRCGSRATPTAMHSSTATPITSSRTRCSTCSPTRRSSGCSRTTPPPWGPVQPGGQGALVCGAGARRPDYAAGVRAADERLDTDVNAVPVTGNSPIEAAE